MKKIIWLSIACVLLTLVASCRRVSNNDKIDGFWLMTGVEDRRTSKPLQVPDYSIAVQLELFQLRSGAGVITGIMNYDEKTGRLSVDFKQPSTIDAETLKGYGIYSNPVTFDVMRSGNHLTLTSPETIITFKKH